MGNKMNVKHREEIETLEVTEKLIRDFQYHINLVDRSVVGFARSIDSMRASCAVFKRDTKDAVGVDVGNGTNLHDDFDAGFLLETIDDVVSDHKFIALESLSRFFTFIIDNGNSYFTPESQMVLSVDKYRQENSSDAELNLQYYDARIESLQNKIKTLNKDYQSAKEDIEMFNRREKMYHTEKKILKTMNEDLKTKSEKNKSQSKESLNTKNAVEQNNEKLRNEIKQLKWNAEQMKKEISVERSSKRATEEIHKAEMEEDMQKILKLKQGENEKLKIIDALERNINSLKEKNQNLSERLSTNRDTVVSLREENALAVKELNENIARLNTESTHFKQQHNKDINTLQETLKHEEMAKDDLKAELESLKDLIRRSDKEKKENNEKLSSLECKLLSLTTSFKDKQQEQDTLEEKHNANMNECLEKNMKLKENLKLQRKNMDEMRAKIESLQETNINLCFDLTQEKEICVSLKEEKASDCMKIMVDEINTIPATLSDFYEKELKTLQECSQEEKTTKEEYVKQLEHLKAEQQKQNEEKYAMDAKLNDLENRIKDLKSDLSKTQSDKDNVVKENNAIERKNEELVKDIGLLKISRDQMTVEIRAEVSRRENIVEKTKVEMEKYQEQIATLAQQLLEKTSTIEEIRSEKMEKVVEIKDMETNLKSLHQENAELRLNLSHERKTISSLREDIISTNMLADEVNKMNTTFKEQYEKEINRLTEYYQKETEVKDQCVKEVGDLTYDQHRYDEKKTSSQLEEENRNTAEINETDTTTESLKPKSKHDIDIYLIKIEKLKNKKKEHEKKIDEMNGCLNEMNMKNSDLISNLQKEINTRVSILEEKTETINSLKVEIENMKTNSEEINQLNEVEKGRLRESLKQEMDKGEEYVEQLKQLKEKQQKDSDEIIQINSEKTSLKNAVKEIELRLELATTNVIHVQVCYATGFRAFQQDQALQKVLKTRMEAGCIELKFLNCSQRFSTLSTEFPSLIVCCRPSRTTRDRYISNVLEGARVTSKTALLIFHERDEKAFRKDMVPVKDTAHSSNIAGIFDIGYKGEIYKCDINSKSIERLFSFINEKGVLKSKSTESSV